MQTFIPFHYKTTQTIALFLSLFFYANCLLAQDPVLPQNNFGQANMLDGAPPGPGGYWFQTLQIYESQGDRNHLGEETDVEVSSLLSMQQFAYITNTKLLDGNFGFTILQPIAKLSATNDQGGFAPTVSPRVLGDVIVGTFVQWFDKKVFGIPISHRLEIDGVLPTGAYDEEYMVNPSAHLYTISLHHTFTLFLPSDFAISIRNHYNFNSLVIDTDIKPGSSYNLNYSLEYGITDKLRIQIPGYYVKQLTEDSMDGDHNYYQDNFGLETTKEEVFAYGIGLSYVFLGGVIEAKVMDETGATNRGEGLRSTLRLTVPLFSVKKPVEPTDQQ